MASFKACYVVEKIIEGIPFDVLDNGERLPCGGFLYKGMYYLPSRESARQIVPDVWESVGAAQEYVAQHSGFTVTLVSQHSSADIRSIVEHLRRV